MAGYILVIDSSSRVPPIVEAAVSKKGVRVVGEKDFVQAKRKMVQDVPELVLAMVAHGGEPQAGCIFCRELQGHPRFKEMPVILITEKLTEDVIRGASDSGAKGLLSWPATVPVLQNRIFSLLPRLGQDEPAEKVKHSPPAPAQKPSARAETAGQPQPVGGTLPATDPKLELAQHLLAKVLHNLKTSALLDIVEVEDVPKVVAEITQSVCGVAGGGSAPSKISSPTAGQKAEGETYLDLDSAFGLKK